MKIAVLTDSHGNLPALQAALAVASQEGCDRIYHTGDAVGIGPYPAECIDLLVRVQARCVLGNHEAYVLDLLPHDEVSGMSAGEVAHHAWVRDVLGPYRQTVIGTWPWLIEEDVVGQRLAFMHYALDASGVDFGLYVPQPTADLLDPLYAHYKADLLFYGHNHAASDVQGQGRYVNPGSLGCFHEPIARFVILTIDADGLYDLTTHAVPYDDTAFLHAFDERNVPDRLFIRHSFLSR